MADLRKGTRDAQFANMLRARDVGMGAAIANRDGSGGISTEDERLQHMTTLTAAERARGARRVRLDTVALREARTAEQLRLMPDLDHGQRPAQRAGSYTPEQLTGIRETSVTQPGIQRAGLGPSSQAGLAAVKGPAGSAPSSPAPGQPGSRFNPVVRERQPRPQRSAGRDMIRSSDVPRSAGGAGAEQQRRGPSAETVARVGIGGAQGAAAGLKVTAAIPHPVAKVVGAAGGAVIGGAMAVRGATSLQAAPRQQAQRQPAPGQKKALSTSQRIKESKAGQVVQSEGFKNGARCVGTEAMRDAATSAARAKQSGFSNKGVVASAAKGAAVGMARGLRTEMANCDSQRAQQGEQGSAQPPKSASASTDLVGRMGSVVGKSAQEQKGSAQPSRKPLSERYDFQFEQDGQQVEQPERDW